MSSSGSDSDSSGDASSGNDSRGISITGQLNAAIRAGSLDNLRALLSQQKTSRHHSAVVKDKDIHKSLHVAAEVGCVESCRLLWGKLSRRGKKKYFAAQRNDTDPGLLHLAARDGRLEILRLFIEEFKFNINQMNNWDKTPLCYASHRLETSRYLLENGANVNQGGGEYSPLFFAVYDNKTEVARLLLIDYHANPNLNRRPADEEEVDYRWGWQPSYRPRNTDHAIQCGNIEILHMLLQCGAYVGHLITARNGTSLCDLLLINQQISRENKVTICRILLEHAKEDHETAVFMRISLESLIKQQTSNEGNCQILLDAGMDSLSAMYLAVQAGNISVCQLLVREYQVDPFLQQKDENNDNDNDEQEHVAASPFLAAARLADTSVFESFLEVWDERFSSSGGKNGDGDYPLHVVCCDPFVSLQAIQVLVNRQADVLVMVDGEQGLLPFHFAAMWDTNLEVIFYLLQHCPDALLFHGGGNAAIHCPSLPTVVQNDTNSSCAESSTEIGGNNGQNQVTSMDMDGPAKKKAKTTTN